MAVNPRRLALALSLALLSAASLLAAPKITAIRPDLGVIFMPNLDPDKETPNLVTYVLGCGAIIPLEKEPLSFEPAVDIYTNYYELDALGRGIPTTVEERSAFVIGLIIDAPLVYSWTLDEEEKWTLSCGGGPAFDIRVGFLAAEEGKEDLGSINAYFWKSLRFFQPTTFVRGEYRLTERVGFGFAIRAYWPIFNLWAGEGLPFFDQSLFCGSLGVNYKL